MNNRNRLIPILLALVGVGLIAFGSVGSVLPHRLTDLFKWLPVPVQVVKYPDAAIVFLEEASERDMDFALVMANKSFTDSLNSRSIEWRVLDDDQPEAAELVKVAKTPSMLFVKPLGKSQYEILVSRSLPKSSKEANEVIAEVMGL
jgi:hypothetical protein